MPLTLAILKYVPAVLCVLLVVAWAVSPFVGVAFGRNGANGFLLEISGGDFWIYPGITDHWIEDSNFGLFTPPRRTYLGRFQAPTWFIIGCPIPFLLTLLLPLSIGPFTRFRFPLWSYFVWTALIAAELAYYLRA